MDFGTILLKWIGHWLRLVHKDQHSSGRPLPRCLCVFSRILGWKIFGRYIDERLEGIAGDIDLEYLNFGPDAFRIPVPWYARQSDVSRTRYRLERMIRDAGLDVGRFDAFIFQGHDLILPFRRARARYIGIVADTTPAITKRRSGPRQGLGGIVRRLFGEWQDRLHFRPAFRRATAFLVLSDFVRRSLVDDYGIDAACVHTVGPPVFDRIAELPARERAAQPVILFVGNDFRRKGGPFLLQLFERHFRGKAELWIVSNGVSADEAGDGVKLYANLPNDEVLGLMLQSHVFVFPSYHDELGLVLAEAACAGLPIVARETGGQSEYVHDGENGFLLPPEADDAAWRDAIDAVIRDGGDWSRLSRRSLEIGRERCTRARFDEQFAAFVREIRAEV